MRIILLAVLCLAAGTAAAHAQAQDKATLPYAKLYDVFLRAAVVKGRGVRAAVAVESKDPAVRPGAITLRIEAKRGARKLRVDPDGEIRGFPISGKLLQENPPVVSNQPKGSLRIGGGMFFNVAATTRYSYRKLYSLLDASNAERKRRAGIFAFGAPQAKSVLFVFFDHTRQTLTVRSKTARQTLTADEKGEIALPLDKSLLAENPTVSLSEKPSKVLPDL